MTIGDDLPHRPIFDVDSPVSGDDEWFDDWFDRAWGWLVSAPAEDAAAMPIWDSASSVIPALPSLPSSMFRSSGIVRGSSARRRDPLAGETLRATGRERSRVDALRMECADPLSPIGSELRWLRRDGDVADGDDEDEGG